MRLDNEYLEFNKYIQETANLFNTLAVYAEKDYWVTMLLKEIFSRGDYVFKGGTSLSKCHHVILRFSEDIDISYEEPFLLISSNEKGKKFKGVSKAIKALNLSLVNAERLKRTGYFNRFECPYPSIFEDSRIEKKVIVELAAQTPSFPCEEKPVQSFIGEYFDKTGRHDLTMKYELEPFIVKTQSLARTLVDKTFAICDYYLSNKCQKHSRHLYDITKILTVINLDESVCDLFKRVKEYRKYNSLCLSAKEGVVLSTVLTNIIKDEVFKQDYNKLTKPLLYEQCSYEACRSSLEELLSFLKLHSL